MKQIKCPEIKFNFSYSLYNDYKESQKSTILKKLIKAVETDDIPQCYGVAGNCVHNPLEDYITENIESNTVDFESLWNSKNLDNLYGLNGKTLKVSDYFFYYQKGLAMIDEWKELGYEIIAEEDFLFPYEHNSNVTVKGFIDVVLKKGDDVIIVDWKTDSTGTPKKHVDQRLFYSWAYYKVHGIIPQEARWVYLRIDKVVSNNIDGKPFTLGDIKEFEKRIYGVIDEILERSTDINLYETGKLTSPFNAYKTLVQQLDKGKITPQQIEIKKEINKMACEIKQIKPISKKQKVLNSIRSDKYSSGAMMGQYMNLWADAKMNGTLDKLHNFEEHVEKNVELRIKLENIEYNEESGQNE